MANGIARFNQPRDVMAHQEFDAARFAKPAKGQRELACIARFVFSRKCRASQLRPDRAQRGLKPHRFISRHHQALAAKFAHLFGGLQSGFKLLLAGIEMQDALGAVVVGNARVSAQLLQHAAAVGAQIDDLPDVVARAGRGAFTQKLQTPRPLARVGAQPEQQRCVFFGKPFEYLEWR